VIHIIVAVIVALDLLVEAEDYLLMKEMLEAIVSMMIVREVVECIFLQYQDTILRQVLAALLTKYLKVVVLNMAQVEESMIPSDRT
jgi:hypothetical protein